MSTREVYFNRQLNIAKKSLHKATSSSGMDRKLWANVGLESINRITDMSYEHDKVLATAEALRKLING